MDLIVEAEFRGWDQVMGYLVWGLDKCGFWYLLHYGIVSRGLKYHKQHIERRMFIDFTGGTELIKGNDESEISVIIGYIK